METLAWASGYCSLKCLICSSHKRVFFRISRMDLTEILCLNGIPPSLTNIELLDSIITSAPRAIRLWNSWLKTLTSVRAPCKSLVSLITVLFLECHTKIMLKHLSKLT